MALAWLPSSAPGTRGSARLSRPWKCGWQLNSQQADCLRAGGNKQQCKGGAGGRLCGHGQRHAGEAPGAAAEDGGRVGGDPARAAGHAPWAGRQQRLGGCQRAARLQASLQRPAQPACAHLLLHTPVHKQRTCNTVQSVPVLKNIVRCTACCQLTALLDMLLPDRLLLSIRASAQLQAPAALVCSKRMMLHARACSACTIFTCTCCVLGENALGCKLLLQPTLSATHNTYPVSRSSAPALRRICGLSTHREDALLAFPGTGRDWPECAAGYRCRGAAAGAPSLTTASQLLARQETRVQ